MNKCNRVASTNYTNPYRPFPIKLLNSLGRNVGSLRRWSELSVDRMIASACRSSGLEDFGDEWFLEPLHHLVQSLNKEANLNLTGSLIQKARITSALITRLRIQDLLTRRPELLDSNLSNVIFIVGLQRTGTTLLHRLIDGHPEIRGTYAWEVLSPVPSSIERMRNPRSRVCRAKWAKQALSYLSPDFVSIHPIDHAAPEEDVILLDLCFMSQSAEAMFRVPSYSAWLERQDHMKAYSYFRDVLKILQWQRPTKYWSLKSPHHMEYLDVLLKVFPSATIVQTHRDPQKTVGSFCSMVAHAVGIFSDTVRPFEIALH